jgi:type I restriction enzyme, R subunit
MSTSSLRRVGPRQAEAIKVDVTHYEKVREETKLASGDYIDLKMFEPAMRHLIDTYIKAEESEKISAFDDVSLVQLIVQRAASAIDALPKGVRENKEAVAETIENNVRKLIIDETPINPKYYEKMSQLLDALIAQRKKEAFAYEEYLKKIADLTAQAANPSATAYPSSLNTAAKRALYDNLGKDEALAIAVDQEIRLVKKDGFRGNKIKEREVRNAIRKHIKDEVLAAQIFNIVVSQHDY